MTSGNDKTEAMHNGTSTTDQIIKLSLFTLSLFLHATEECLVNQPISNYRRLVISNLKKKSFRSALATETTDITEEIYITIYEIKKNESPAFTTPKITSTYSTKEGSYDLSNLSGYHAIYPTQIGLIKLAKALKLHQDKLDYYGQISDIDRLLVEILNEVVKHQDNLRDMVFLPGRELGTHQYDRYRALRTRFQQGHNIRISIMGGLHRTALATHLLGNWKIHNGPATINDFHPHEAITSKSPLNFSIVVHVILPAQHRFFTNAFLDKCRKMSEDINNRTYKQHKVMTSGQLFDLLTEKTPQEDVKLRFIPTELYEGSAVSIYPSLFCIKTKFLFFYIYFMYSGYKKTLRHKAKNIYS